MPLLVIYSIPDGGKCPPAPADDLGAMVKIGNPFNYGEAGNATIYTVQVPDNTDVYIFAKNSLKPGKCTWEPTQGTAYIKHVGTQTETFCVPCTCTTVRNLLRPLNGWYVAKRTDQSETFQIEMNFTVNAEYCLVCDIIAPGKLDQARAFFHSKPGPGNHGITHPGDFMNNSNPLTEGFLQGTFVGPHGERGSLRMVHALIPTGSGAYKIHFGGFLTFAGGPNIETVFTSVNAVQWPTNGNPA